MEKIESRYYEIGFVPYVGLLECIISCSIKGSRTELELIIINQAGTAKLIQIEVLKYNADGIGETSIEDMWQFVEHYTYGQAYEYIIRKLEERKILDRIVSIKLVRKEIFPYIMFLKVMYKDTFSNLLNKTRNNKLEDLCKLANSIEIVFNDGSKDSESV